MPPLRAGVVFHATAGLDPPALAAVQACVRQRLLRVFMRRALPDFDSSWIHEGEFR